LRSLIVKAYTLARSSARLTATNSPHSPNKPANQSRANRSTTRFERIAAIEKHLGLDKKIAA
jgi:hypothetical protein